MCINEIEQIPIKRSNVQYSLIPEPHFLLLQTRAIDKEVLAPFETVGSACMRVLRSELPLPGTNPARGFRAQKTQAIQALESVYL